MDRNFHLIAPSYLPTNISEAEILGTAVWLWMHSTMHQDAPLHALSTDLLPAIKHKQFALVVEDGKPVFYISWANLSADAEQRYLNDASSPIPENEWNSGENTWVLDWVAPFGHSVAMRSLLARTVFENRCFRSLYHRGNEKGLRVMNFHGNGVLPEEFKFWIDTHPVDLPNK